jgi:hypothetical protein
MLYEPGTEWQYDVPTTGSTHLPPDAGYGKALTNQGYGFEVAVADLIDNSIDAKADKIVVHFLRDADRILTLLIIDNGKGMDEAGLDAAMTVGRRRDYGADALGMYGTEGSFSFPRFVAHRRQPHPAKPRRRTSPYRGGHRRQLPLRHRRRAVRAGIRRPVRRSHRVAGNHRALGRRAGLRDSRTRPE